MVSTDVGGWFGTGEGVAIGLEVVLGHGEPAHRRYRHAAKSRTRRRVFIDRPYGLTVQL